MNWSIIWWFAGIVGTFYGLKFVLELFKTLFGKESRENMMEAMGASISRTNKRITKAMRKKIQDQKRKKQNGYATVTIK